MDNVIFPPQQPSTSEILDEFSTRHNELCNQVFGDMLELGKEPPPMPTSEVIKTAMEASFKQLSRGLSDYAKATQLAAIRLSKLHTALMPIQSFHITASNPPKKRAMNSILINVENMSRDLSGKKLIRNRKLWINRKRAYDRRLREWVVDFESRPHF